MRLKDQIAIITGAGSGIGRAIALKFSQNGAKVVIADRNVELAQETLKMIVKEGNDAISLKVDVTEYLQVKGMVDKAIDSYGKIDILVNNAGWEKFGLFIDTKPDYWDKIIKLNLMGQVYCTRAVLDNMVRRKKGAIVNIASDAGRNGFRGEVIYSAAKGGVIAFTKALSKEMGEYGIRLNSIAPGPIETPLLKVGMEKSRDIADEMLKRKDQTPLKRFGTPEEVADLALFLGSNESAFITGQVVSINGGFVMYG